MYTQLSEYREKLENKKGFVRKEWNIFNRIDENRIVFAVFGNRRGDVFEYQGAGRGAGVSVSELVCFTQQRVEGQSACGGGV